MVTTGLNNLSENNLFTSITKIQRDILSLDFFVGKYIKY